MKKYFSLFAFALFAGVLTFSLSACGGDDDDSSDQGQEAEHNTLDVAVTGQVTETAALYAVISGVVNVDQITASYSSIEFGIEISTSNDFYSSRRVAASGLVGRTFSVRVTGLQPVTKYYYRTYVDISSLTFAYFGSTLSFTTAAPSSGGGVDNGHVYVDLGLPSGLKWADRNVGADKVEAYGNYFAWGETKAKSDYSWSTYAYGSASDKLTKYCSSSSYGQNGYTDALTELELSDDAARANWGGNWRMPTSADFQELINNTTAEWVENYNGTGVEGYRFTASNGNHIFLPVAGCRKGAALYGLGLYGYYWSRSLNQSGPGGAYYLDFNSGGVYVNDYGSRGLGRSVRPVRS